MKLILNKFTFTALC